MRYYNISPLETFVLEYNSTYMIMKIWATNNPTNMQHLTQHAKINSECNKLTKPSKPFKIMISYAKIKMTLDMEFDHLGQELLFSP